MGRIINQKNFLMPAVSIIIPIYGVEQYIEKCARSLFEQTLEDIEYIFVDDCTTDKSIEILQKVMAEYPLRQPQTKIIRHETNQGLPQARKTGIENSTGEYIGHCDSDDWVDKDMYSSLYHNATKNQYDIITCDLLKTEQEYTNILSYFAQKPQSKEYIFTNIFSNTCLHNLVGTLAKRDLYSNIKIPNTSLYEDLVFTTQLFHHAKSVGYLPKPFYHYIIGSASMTNVVSTDQKIKNLILAKQNFDIILDFLKENNLNEKYASTLKLFHNLNYQTIIRTKQLNKEYQQHRYPQIKGGVIFNRDFNWLLKIRYIILSLRMYWLYDILDRKATQNPKIKNKVSK